MYCFAYIYILIINNIIMHVTFIILYYYNLQVSNLLALIKSRYFITLWTYAVSVKPLFMLFENIVNC